MICPYCDTRNPDDVKICQFCNQRFVTEIDFTKPLNKLTKIANEMVRRDIPADPTLIKREFEQIGEVINALMNEAVSIIEGNITDVGRLKREGKGISELNTEALEKVLVEFDQAQTSITDGLQAIGENLIGAKTSAEISTGLHEYTLAMREINDGIARMQTVTYGTSDLSSLKRSPEEAYIPPEIFRSRRNLEKAIKGLGAFYEFEDTKLVRFSIAKIRKAHDLLLDLLYEYDEEVDEEEYFYFGEDIGEEAIDEDEYYSGDEDVEDYEEPVDEDEYSSDVEDEEDYEEDGEYFDDDEDDLEDDDDEDEEESITLEEIMESASSINETGYNSILQDEDWIRIVQHEWKGKEIPTEEIAPVEEYRDDEEEEKPAPLLDTISDLRESMD